MLKRNKNICQNCVKKAFDNKELEEWNMEIIIPQVIDEWDNFSDSFCKLDGGKFIPFKYTLPLECPFYLEHTISE